MGCPATLWSPMIGFSIGGKATSLLSNEAERGEGSRPVKPLRRIRQQVQLTVLRTDDDIVALSTVFNQRRHARPRTMLGGIEESRDMHRTNTLRSSSWRQRLWKRGGKAQFSQQFSGRGFQSRESSLDRDFAFLKQCQRELGKLFLKRHDLGFQAGKFLDQVRLKRWHPVFRREGNVFLRRSCQSGSTRHDRRGRRLEWTLMPSRHLQEVFLRHTFDVCIGRVGCEGKSAWASQRVKVLG